MDGLGSSGPTRLFVLSFRGISNFIVPVTSFLFLSSRLIFVRSFVSASNSTCVSGMVNITTGPRFISTIFATVGSIFLLSKRFFWSSKSFRGSRIWPVRWRRLIARCTTTAWCRTNSTMRLNLKCLAWIRYIPGVNPTPFPPFRFLATNPCTNTVSLVVADLPTRLTSISFRNVIVVTLMICVCCVLLVLGVPPPVTGWREGVR